MSKTKFTEGPWEWVPIEYGYFLRAASGTTVLEASGINDGDEPLTYIGEDASAADLAMIAAAPEMYDLVQLLADTVKYYIKKDELANDQEGARLKRNTLVQVEATLAKARGETC